MPCFSKMHRNDRGITLHKSWKFIDWIISACAWVGTDAEEFTWICNVWNISLSTLRFFSYILNLFVLFFVPFSVSNIVCAWVLLLHTRIEQINLPKTLFAIHARQVGANAISCAVLHLFSVFLFIVCEKQDVARANISFFVSRSRYYVVQSTRIINILPECATVSTEARFERLRTR